MSELLESSMFHDEPYFFLFSSETNKDHTGTAGSFNRDEARNRTYFEHLERLSQTTVDLERVKVGKYSEIKNPIDLSSFPFFWKNKDLYEKFKEISIGWVDGKEIIDVLPNGEIKTKDVMLPAYTVYFEYKWISDDERNFAIQQKNSNGGALGKDLNHAIQSGLFEIVERDSTIISYYTRTAGKIIDVSKITDPEIRYVLHELDRTNFEYHFFDISLVPEIPVIMCFLIDKKNRFLPHTTMSSCASFDIKRCLIHCVEECLQQRPWLRENLPNLKIEDLPPPNELSKLIDRAVYWNKFLCKSKVRSILSFYWKTSEKIILTDEMIQKEEKAPLYKLFKILKKDDPDIKIYFSDITAEKAKKENCVAVKTLTSSMHPFSLDEKIQILTGKRIEKYGSINKTIPHFLL